LPNPLSRPVPSKGPVPLGPLDYDWDQPQDGYRFSEDSILLSEFLPESQDGLVADFGAGCGVVGLEALLKGRLLGIKTLFMAEREEAFLPYLRTNSQRAVSILSELSEKNGAISSISSQNPVFPPKIEILLRDFRELDIRAFGGKLSHIFSNPPYYPLHRGRVGKGPYAGARHELYGGLSELIGVSYSLLKKNGLLSLSLPAGRLSEVRGLLEGRFKLVLRRSPKGADKNPTLIRLRKEAPQKL
jgi:tRNA1(Val) A37 N6-methylase TrmN6